MSAFRHPWAVAALVVVVAASSDVEVRAGTVSSSVDAHGAECFAVAKGPGRVTGMRIPDAAEEEAPEMAGWNKALRFGLELGALGAMAWWGYEQTDGAGRYAWMVGTPVAAAAAWGVFAVPGDPSRGQDGVVRVSGLTRLLIEGAFFGFATWALSDLGEDPLAIGLGSTVVVHYAFSLDRLGWLLGR